MKHVVAIIGVAVLAATAHSTAQPTSANRQLLRTLTISKDVSSLEVQDTGGSFVVLLYGKSFPDGQPFKPFDNVPVQVWLLRHDGKAQSRLDNPPGRIGLANAGSATEIISFEFARSSQQDLAAVVVSINGEMFVRKIE